MRVCGLGLAATYPCCPMLHTLLCPTTMCVWVSFRRVALLVPVVKPPRKHTCPGPLLVQPSGCTMSAKFSQPLRTCVGESEAGVCESGASATVIDLCDSSDGALPGTALAMQDIADVPAAAHATPEGSDGTDFEDAPGVLFSEGLDWSPVRLPKGLELSELRLPYIPAPKCRCEYLAAEATRDCFVTFELLMYLAKSLPKAKMRAIATGNGASVRSKQQASFYYTGGHTWPACHHAHTSLVHFASINVRPQLPASSFYQF